MCHVAIALIAWILVRASKLVQIIRIIARGIQAVEPDATFMDEESGEPSQGPQSPVYLPSDAETCLGGQASLTDDGSGTLKSLPQDANTAQNPQSSRIDRLKNGPSSPTTPDVQSKSGHDAPPSEEKEQTAYPENDGESLLPPPDFRPFFTLIEDAYTGQHYHPAVHYVFSDDDPQALAEACLHAHDGTGSVWDSSPPDMEDEAKESTLQAQAGVGVRAGASGSHTEAHGATAQERSLDGVEERVVIVDIAADGKTVVGAKSLSAEWQVTSARVGPAPTREDAGSNGGGGGLMLHIEGVEAWKSDEDGEEREDTARLLESAKKASGGDTVAALNSLLESSKDGMATLEKVLGVPHED